jgi:hypothetical protein
VVPVSWLKQNHGKLDANFTYMRRTRYINKKIVSVNVFALVFVSILFPTFRDGNKREAAMSSLDGALRVVLTLLIIEFGWGIAVLVGMFFHSIIVFYAIGSVVTAGSVIGTEETEPEGDEVL